MRKLLFIGVASLTLACVACFPHQPIREAYHPEPNIDIVQGTSVNPRVIELSEIRSIKSERARLSREGYVCFGHSVFEGCRSWRDMDIENHAKKRNAEMVIWQRSPSKQKGLHDYTAYYFTKNVVGEREVRQELMSRKRHQSNIKRHLLK